MFRAHLCLRDKTARRGILHSSYRNKWCPNHLRHHKRRRECPLRNSMTMITTGV